MLKRTINLGASIRIVTGAVLPNGADCVVRFEDTDKPVDKSGPNKMRDVAARHGSRRLSHFSTAWNVDGLIFRVRDGYGSFPAAMAATSSQGPDLNRSVAALQATA